MPIVWFLSPHLLRKKFVYRCIYIRVDGLFSSYIGRVRFTIILNTTSRHRKIPAIIETPKFYIQDALQHRVCTPNCLPRCALELLTLYHLRMTSDFFYPQPGMNMSSFSAELSPR